MCSNSTIRINIFFVKHKILLLNSDYHRKMKSKKDQPIENNTFVEGSRWDKGENLTDVKINFQSEVHKLVIKSKGMMGDPDWHGVDRTDSKFLTLACKGDRNKSAKDPTKCSFLVHCLVRDDCALEIKHCHTFHCKDKCIFWNYGSKQCSTNDGAAQLEESIALNNAKTLVPPVHITSSSTTTSTTNINGCLGNHNAEVVMSAEEESNSLELETETVESTNIAVRKRFLRVMLSGTENAMSNFAIVKGNGVAKSFQQTFYNNTETRINIRSVQRYVCIIVIIIY